jgi:integrase
MAETTRPDKPYPEFPLFPHSKGYWCKTIKGKQWAFGPWSDPDAALQKYLDWRDQIMAGRDPRRQAAETSGSVTLKELCNLFLAAKKSAMEQGELSIRAYAEYRGEAKRVCDCLGRETGVATLMPADFAKLRNSYPSTWGIMTVMGHITKTKAIFKFGFENRILERDVSFGTVFVKPTRSQFRRNRQQAESERGLLLFTADELRTVIAKADGWLKPAILLGIQAGLGNKDVAALTDRHVDLEKGWVTYSRPKTGVYRSFPLWPETVAAIQAYSEKRGSPKDIAHSNLCFLTRQGCPLVTEMVHADGRHIQVNNPTLSFAKLLKKEKLKRADLNFYSLRRTFETIAGRSKDQVAVDHIMGHADDSMAGVYRQQIEPERLRAVVQYVREWLYALEKS